MKPIGVIGIGPGNEMLLTQEARSAMDSAEAVFCAERHRALVKDAGRLQPLTPFSESIPKLRALAEQGRETAVLVSGDAGLYSITELLRRTFGAENLHVHPGIGALQAFCAALGISWQDAAICSAHGRALSPSALCHAVRTHGRTFVFLDGVHTPHWVHETLIAGGLKEVSLFVGERLSYSDQSAARYEDREYDSLSIACIENPAPAKGLPPIGLPDEAFIRGKTPMTKREIRTQAVCALQLAPDAVVWDIGSGTGSVTVECARQCPEGTVYAVERDEAALELTRANVRNFHLLNVEVVPGDAAEQMRSLPAPTHVFMGGTGGEAADILHYVAALPNPVRVCAAAVTMESAQQLHEIMKSWKQFTMTQLAVTRLEKVGNYTMFRAQNPVFLLSAETEA